MCVTMLSLLQGDIDGVEAEPNDRKVREIELQYLNVTLVICVCGLEKPLYMAKIWHLSI